MYIVYVRTNTVSSYYSTVPRLVSNIHIKNHDSTNETITPWTSNTRSDNYRIFCTSHRNRRVVHIIFFFASSTLLTLQWDISFGDVFSSARLNRKMLFFLLDYGIVCSSKWTLNAARFFFHLSSPYNIVSAPEKCFLLFCGSPFAGAFVHQQ